MIQVENSVKLLRKLLANVKPTANGCLEWTGWRTEGGYGSTYYQGRSRVTHRLMYAATKGPIPEGMRVLHSCDNPCCISPTHLSLGTDAENIRQSVERGRHAKASNTHCSKSHSFEEHGVRGSNTGWRACKICDRTRQRIAAGWPKEFAESEPKRQGRSPAGITSKWRQKRGPVAPKTHCIRGHELSGDNLYMTPDGRRQCRACHLASVRKFRPKPAGGVSPTGKPTR